MAGVSVATVSRVLNGTAIVSVDTKTAVTSAIDALQFRPSAAARAINSGRSYIVGALLPTLDNSIFSRFLVGLETRLHDFGLSVIVAGTGDDPEVECTKAEQMINIGAEGLVVSGVTHSEEFHRLIKRASVPAVAISYFDRQSSIPTVGYDNAEAVGIAMSHLTELGHQNIAVIHGPKRNNDRTRARLDAITAHKSVGRLGFFEAAISIEGGRAGAARLLQDARPCSAVLCLSDVLATGVLYELRHRGIDVPGQMSVMGVENLPSSAHTVPALTTVRLQVAEMGVQAADALGNWVANGIEPDHQCLSSTLMARESTGLFGH